MSGRSFHRERSVQGWDQRQPLFVRNPRGRQSLPFVDEDTCISASQPFGGSLEEFELTGIIESMRRNRPPVGSLGLPIGDGADFLLVSPGPTEEIAPGFVTAGPTT